MLLNLLFLLIFLLPNLPEEIIKQSESFTIGVVDRVEGNYAVILLEEEEKELIVPTNRHTKEGKWLLIYLETEEPLILWTLDEYENKQKMKIQHLHEKLLQKNSSYN
ncbi:DUF3006 family protein [Oceanobacillus sp. CAU 1775]